MNEKGIVNFCKGAEHMCQYNKLPSLAEALKIIEQLQVELADVKAGFWGRACARHLIQIKELKKTITWMLADMDFRNEGNADIGFNKVDLPEVAKAREQVK